MKIYAKLLFLSLLGLPAISALAMSVDWSGGYRFEFVELDRPSLDSNQSLRKSYLLNHLHLKPKIIASDGITVNARFDILQNAYYPDSQVGQAFGVGANRTGVSSTTADSSVAGGQQRSSYLQVSHLYMSINQEYGAIVVGRAPVHFGLGMTHNAGNGAFDHWYDVKDMIGYKFLIGNLSIMPIVGKVYDYSVAQGRDVTDVIWNVEYNNAETESIFGLWHQTRSSSLLSNDAPAAELGGSAINGGWNSQDVNIFLARGFESVKFRLEAGFLTGSTGVFRGAEEIKLNGYGIALETDFVSETKSQWQLKMGMASGDNPDTVAYEGYHFDRNYDVAFLLFNHPLGQYDLFRSYAQRNIDNRAGCVATVASPCAKGAIDEVVDEDAVSNVFYISPRFKRSINDRWDWTGNFTYAQLVANPLSQTPTANAVAKDVGYELDLGFIYKPTERIQWVNEVGLLMPGGAYKGGTRDYKTGFTHGVQSKVSITF